MQQVLKAQPFQMNQMGSFGQASGMLLRQHKFPDTFRDDEKIISADSDRLSQWDYQGYREILEEFKTRITGNHIETWFQSGKAQDIMDFITAMMVRVCNADPNTKWTGFRVLGTVNKATGYSIYSLQLFAKNPRSGTKVYSGHAAPNVLEPKRSREQYDAWARYCGVPHDYPEEPMPFPEDDDYEP